MGAKRTWTDAQLVEAVERSLTVAEVIRYLGLKCWRGGSSFRLVKRHIERLGLSTSHFLGQGANKGNRYKGGPKRAHFSEVLARSYRTNSASLRRAVREAGVPYKCVCGNEGEWMGALLTLQLDHKDGNKRNNKKANLRFLCPNCHSQTPTWGRKVR